MLVLTRKPNEKLHIGNNITITIIQIRSNKVKIGIHAPGDVQILRGELAEWLLDVPASEDGSCGVNDGTGTHS